VSGEREKAETLVQAARLERPRALLFDWDSTLVDNWRSIEYALNATMRAMGKPLWTEDETRRRVRESMRDSFPRLFGDRWPEARKIFYDAFVEKHLEHLAPLPGAGDMLAALAADGFYLGVVSNKQGALLRKEADHLGWTRYFGRLVGSGDASGDKPDPASVALALEGSGIAPGRDVWLVGDTAIDMRCAVGSGCVPVLIMGHGREMDDFSACAPECEIADCEALTALVRGLQAAHMKG
jgi:phosphoglycolate phosphatase